MGMEQRWATVTGPDFSSAWKRVQEEDHEDRGHGEGYSGSLKHVNYITEVSKSKFNDYQEGKADLDKGDAVYYCEKKPKANTNKVQTKVDNFPVKGTRKWETKYVIRKRRGEYDEGGSFPSQSLAIKEARRLSEEDGGIYQVHIEKHLTNQPTTRVAEISYKKSSTQEDGVWQVYAELRC